MGGLNRVKTGWGLITARWGWVAAAAGVGSLLLIAAALVVEGNLRIGLLSTSFILFGLAELLLLRALGRSKLRRSITARLQPISGPFNSLNVSFLSAVILLLPALSADRDLFTIMVAIVSGGFLFAYALVLMTTESGRKRVFTRLYRLGPPRAPAES